MIKSKGKATIYNQEEIDDIISRYVSGKSLASIGVIYGISNTAIVNIMLKHKVTIRKPGKSYSVNSNYFKNVDCEEKAYWLGFIWCDSYVNKRDRRNSGQYSYEFKLSLKEDDFEHLNKLKKSISSNHEIKFYDVNAFGKMTKECRLYISNNTFGSIFYNVYGIIPHRSDVTMLISSIPSDLKRHFIRGILDADGSIGGYDIHDRKVSDNYISRKYIVRFSTYINLVNWIQEEFINEDLTTFKPKLIKRHLDRDGECINCSYCGHEQVKRILKFLYEDSTVYLDRKYKIYNSIMSE